MTALPRLLLLLALIPAAFAADQSARKPGREPLDRPRLLEAREKVLRELDAEPKSLQLWKRLAMIQRHLGDEKGTEAALAKAAALAPKDAGVNFMYGLLHEKREERARAAAAFRACLAGDPRDKMKELCAKHLRRVEAP